MHDESAIIRAALDAGAHGYLLKEAPATELVAAVTALADGRHYLQPDLGARLTRRTTSAALTGREQQAMSLWAAGNTNNDVATALGVSIRTVESLRAALRTRLGLNTRADLARYANRHLHNAPTE
jgi:DNA-binding NarL/FixJ family response regulator